MHKEMISPKSKFTDITDNIDKYINELDLQDGIVVLQVKDSEYAVVVTNSDPAHHEDIYLDLVRVIPTKLEVESEDVSALARQVRTSILGRSMPLSVVQGSLQLQTTDRVYLVTYLDSEAEVEVLMTAI